jgi:plastocyanin
MRVLRLVGAAVVIAACGGAGDGGNGGTQPPPPVTSVFVSPSTTQSIQACGNVSFTAESRNAQGGAVSGAPITWAASGQAISLSSTSGTSTTATGVGVGSSTITASSGTVTSNPGVTVNVTAGGASASADVTATGSNIFSPSCVSITAGGTVTWTFVATPSHNVTFPQNEPPGGDIATTQSTTVSRTFPTAGRYDYTCTLHGGMNGVVVVQ